MEREKKNPPIVQQHCLAIAMRPGTSPILGTSVELKLLIQCRIKASQWLQSWMFNFGHSLQRLDQDP